VKIIGIIMGTNNVSMKPLAMEGIEYSLPNLDMKTGKVSSIDVAPPILIRELGFPFMNGTIINVNCSLKKLDKNARFPIKEPS
jgi:hypothetical protein